MHKRIASLLLTGGGAALALCLSATAASATATTLTVKVTGGGSFTAKASTTTLKDGSVSVTCSTSGSTPASSASAAVKTGTDKGSAPVKVGTTSNLKFNNCTGPLGPVTASPTKEPYALNADSATSGGATAAVITGVDVNVSMTGCSFTVTGSAPGDYNNSKHTLNMTPSPSPKPLTKAQLTISNVNGCAGVVSNGQHPTYTSSYSVSPATLSITSTG